MSARISTRDPPSACSGAMKSTVPTTASLSSNSVRLSPAEVSDRASPMSSSLTVPSAVTMRLAGFTSRWTNPFSCAC